MNGFDYTFIYASMKGVITFFATIVLLKYFIYLVAAPFYTLKKELWSLKIKRLIKKGKLPEKYEPLVSVIIPAWNEEVGIIPTIKSAINNTYPNIEVVVVNDGSDDKTDELVKRFAKEYNEKNTGKRIVYISKENGGKGAALNHGIQKAKGEIIVTKDADSLHDKNAVENIVRYFRDPEIHALVGNVKVSNSSSVVGLLQKLEYLFGFYFKRVHSLFNAEYIFGGACAAFRKDATFDKLGLFDTENKTEDIEYSMRVKLYGLKAVYAEDVITYTEGASTLNGLYKQRLRWKKGRIDTFLKYKELFFSNKKHHSTFLSWVVLPYALIGEIQMLLEPMFFVLIWTYTFISGDYLSIGLSSLFMLLTFFFAIFFGDNKTSRLYFFTFLSCWLLFYVLIAIEFLALVKSIELALAKKDITWQRWQRQGIGNQLSIKESAII